ncbi:MAG: TolC family protein [Aquificota bacterium]|nr:TolC family protein [Aquificota bacterium]
MVLRVPLFDGRASFYRERSILELKRAVEIEREDISERIKREILRAPYDWEALTSAHKEAESFDSWAQENLDLSRSNYELELAFDLGYAMSTKTEAERRLMEARFRIILFLMRLYDLLGMDPMRVFKEKDSLLYGEGGGDMRVIVLLFVILTLSFAQEIEVQAIVKGKVLKVYVSEGQKVRRDSS